MNALLTVARKELYGFFSSPAAYLFFAAFLIAILFDVFWVNTFFARNIADVRPLFESMPVLMIFLSAAITMRVWSEERRSGTLELLLTAPMTPAQLVIGKFLACLALVIIALLLTLPIPICVALIGGLDWGPVLGGYLASLFLAAAYLAIGLFISARSENQLVSLIVSTLISGALYLVGTDTLTSLLGNQGAEWLQLIGTGARFDSITRGVIDLRDLYYYASLVAVFLCLNIIAIERLRWPDNRITSAHRQRILITVLLSANMLYANIPLHALSTARIDMTQGHLYSISNASRQYLEQLQEPLLIRGYFSAKTHPLLAPLVPRLHDLLKEYAIAGGNKVRVEIIDPHDAPVLEREAGEKYGIKPVPFQTASKYQASVVNSYFDILVKYGDQYETLGFRDLIDIKAQAETEVKVDLRNPEYDITRAIKKVLQSYQGADNLFSKLPKVSFTGYLTPDAQLPDSLRKVHQELTKALDALKSKAGDKLTIRILDPDAGNGALARDLRKQYGFTPMTTSLLDDRRFWFYMTLQSGQTLVQIPLPTKLGSGDIKRSLQAALKRFSRGFLKTVAIYQKKAQPDMSRFGMPSRGGKHYTLLRDQLAQNFSLIDTDLSSGVIPEQADFLLILSPQGLNQKQLFAIDQFLMRGGNILIAASPFQISMRGQLSATAKPTGLEDWLSHNGLKLEPRMILDPQNSAFPIPVQRNLGGFMINEAKLIDYPYFIDLRRDGIDQSSGLMTGIDQVTLSWAAPIALQDTHPEKRRIRPLLKSTAKAWSTEKTEVQPDFQRYSPLGFPIEGQQTSQDIGVLVQGQFESYFTGKTSPLISTTAPEDTTKTKQDPPQAQIGRIIEHSPNSSRIILFSSSTFISDEIIDLMSSTMGTRYRTPLQLIENTIDWSLSDRGLLAIRGRAQFAHTLPPLSHSEQIFWESLNYGLVLIGLLTVWLIQRGYRTRAQHRYLAWLQQTDSASMRIPS